MDQEPRQPYKECTQGRQWGSLVVCAASEETQTIGKNIWVAGTS